MSNESVIVGPQLVRNYIPQRSPMVMVDALLSYSAEEAKTAFMVKPDNVLLEEDCLSEAGLLEHVAQSAALGKGYEFALKNEKPPLGFLGAVKKLKIMQLPKPGQQIETQIILKHVIMNASVVEAKVFVANEMIASCELSIFINPKTS